MLFWGANQRKTNNESPAQRRRECVFWPFLRAQAVGMGFGLEIPIGILLLVLVVLLVLLVLVVPLVLLVLPGLTSAPRIISASTTEYYPVLTTEHYRVLPSTT